MLNRDNEHVDLNIITEVDQRVNVTAKLVDLWESQNNDITQVGLLGDKTGSIKSTKWAKSDLPKLTEGHVTLLNSSIGDTFSASC